MKRDLRGRVVSYVKQQTIQSQNQITEEGLKKRDCENTSPCHSLGHNMISWKSLKQCEDSKGLRHRNIISHRFI